MSLVWRRRAIARAVAGDLAPAAESRLRTHLRRCHACRRHYDALSLLAPQTGRERARLMAALAPPPAPSPRRVWRWSLVLVPATAAVLLLARPKPEITWRGDESAEDARAVAARASLSLRLYARRKPASPVRLVGEVPGSGELHVSAGEELQLAYAGLTEPRHVVVLAIDEGKHVHRYYPRDGNPGPLPPSREPRLLGPPIDVSALRGRVRLVAVVTKTPLDPAAAESEAQRKGEALEAVLWVAP